MPHRGWVDRADRAVLNGHPSKMFWFTGLSGAGKSTLAYHVERRLHGLGFRSYVFDGDNVRTGLCGDLGFSTADRGEDIRRIAEMGKLFVDGGLICLAAFISPMRADRERVRQIIGVENMAEAYIKCPVEVCASRDEKGFYKLAMEGKIQNYTGVSSPYEAPVSPDLVVETHRYDIEESCALILSFMGAQLGMSLE